MENSVSWFGRDPAAVVAQATSAAIALIMLLPLPSEGLTAALSAVVIAVGGIVVAFAVQRDGQLPALVGLGRAGIALAVILGVPWSETYQGLLLVAIEQVAQFFIRDRVVAKINQLGERRPPVYAEDSAHAA